MSLQQLCRCIPSSCPSCSSWRKNAGQESGATGVARDSRPASPTPGPKQRAVFGSCNGGRHPRDCENDQSLSGIPSVFSCIGVRALHKMMASRRNVRFVILHPHRREQLLKRKVSDKQRPIVVPGFQHACCRIHITLRRCQLVPHVLFLRHASLIYRFSCRVSKH